ncbi:putative transcription regulator mTERF family [Rosa chinensis]|uniref:Putative transcription regulator mTERF family n=1 Tax=Rosa chinensis TaxID=74649 RepID=A0A2P6PSB4_ROSCH|nr:uncharacterized protein LOC112171303 [Rosa chinensis]PRQ24827.1 putative transcription regulator mTERF family [Rosa chinensis]
MNTLNGLRTLALRCSIFTIPSSQSHSSLQNQLFYRRHISTTTTSEIQANITANYLIKSCGFSPEAADSVSKKFKLSSQERADSVLAFLRTHGGLSETQISKLLRSYPGYLAAACPEKTLLPKIEFYRSLGLSKENFARTVSSNPLLLSVSLEKRILPTYNYLKSFRLSKKNVASVFKSGARIFLEGHTKNVEPNLGLLKELGMSQECISKLLTHFTHYLMLKHQRFRQVVDDVMELGFSMDKYTAFGTAIRAFWGKDSKLKMSQCREVYMTKWGWTENDVQSALKKYPRCMILSEKKIEQVMDFIVNKMGLVSGRTMARYPQIWTCSFDKKVIPRCMVFKVLLLRGLVNENLSLGYVVNISEDKFLERFVGKYFDQVPQLMSVYQGKVDIQDL